MAHSHENPLAPTSVMETFPPVGMENCLAAEEDDDEDVTNC